MNPYSPLKIFHQQDWLEEVRQNRQPSPIFVEIIPTNRCNQRCKHCAYRMEGYTSNSLFDPTDELSWDKLQEIVCDCVDMGVKAIELTGGGEPTIHPQFLQLCDLILEYGLDLGLVTNGVRWTPGHTELLCNAKWVRFSIDAGDPCTYSFIRHSNEKVYSSVLNNISQLADRKCDDLLIGVSFVVTKENWREVSSAADLAYNAGAANFRISAVFQNEGDKYFEEFDTEVRELITQVVEKYKHSSFKIFNLYFDRLNDLSQGRPDYSFCGFQQAATYIGADYNVYRCCVLAYSEEGVLGNLRNQSFKELWEGEDKQRRIKEFNARNCERCMFNNKNRTILYALDINPLHGNFI